MATDLNKLTVAQLKEELSKNGLEITGKKSELVARLESFKMAEGNEVEEEEEAMNTDEGQAAAAAETAEETADSQEAAADEAQKDDENGTEEPQEAEEAVVEADGGKDDEAAADDEALEAELGDEQQQQDGDEAQKTEGDDEKSDDKEEKMEPVTGQEDLESDPNFMCVTWVDNKLIWIPIKDQIKEEVLGETRWRTVLVYPLLLSDLQDAVLAELLSKALHFTINFRESFSVKDRTEEGYVEIIYKSFDEAKEMAEESGIIRESVNIRHLGYTDNKADIINEWRKEKISEEDTILSRLMYLGNLPKDMDENQLREMFPDGLRAILARKEDREHRGYGYIEYNTEEEVTAAVEKHKDLEIQEQKICVMKCMKEKPEGMMSDKERENIVRKVRGIRNNLKFNGRTMSRNEQQYLKTMQSRLLEKLRTDTTVRKANGLLPPDRLKKLEEREARLLKEAEERNASGVGHPGMRGRGSGQFRGNQRGRGGMGRGMGRGGQQWSPRGGRGGFRGGWGGSPGWQGGRGGGGQRQGEVAVAMDLLNNLSQALSGGGGGGGGPSRFGGGNDGNWGGSYSTGGNTGGGYVSRGGGYGNRGGGGGGYGNQGGGYGNQGSWNANKRRLSNEGQSDWKRRPGGGGDGGRRGGGYGGGGGAGRNWNY